MHIRHALVVVWTCFLTRGLFYSTTVPLWEGFDEFSHFGRVQQMALEGGRGADTGREVVDSLKLVPLPWTLRGLDASHLTHDEWWQLPATGRAARQQALGELRPQEPGEASPNQIRLWEAQQPPLYYAIMAVPYRLLRARPLAERVWALRLFSVMLASAVVPLGWLAGRRLLGSDWLGMTVPVMAAAMPGLLMDISRVGNESLAVALYSVMLVCSLSPISGDGRTAIALGTAWGAGLLTKAYFLSAALPLGVLGRQGAGAR